MLGDDAKMAADDVTLSSSPVTCMDRLTTIGGVIDRTTTTCAHRRPVRQDPHSHAESQNTNHSSNVIQSSNDPKRAVITESVNQNEIGAESLNRKALQTDQVFHESTNELNGDDPPTNGRTTTVSQDEHSHWIYRKYMEYSRYGIRITFSMINVFCAQTLVYIYIYPQNHNYVYVAH